MLKNEEEVGQYVCVCGLAGVWNALVASGPRIPSSAADCDAPWRERQMKTNRGETAKGRNKEKNDRKQNIWPL